jgi:hypothetical protein
LPERNRMEQPEPLICEDVEPKCLRALASAVVTQAVKDLTARRQPFEKRLTALIWLTGPEYEMWSDFAGLEPNVYKLLPRLGQAKQIFERKVFR